MTAAWQKRLVHAAAARYRPAGHFAGWFARGKLGGDPVFPALLRHGLIPDGSRLVDLGCGQGLLAVWLLAAQRQFETGDWPADWPAPPRLGHYLGVECLAAEAERARQGLGAAAEIITGDLRTVAWPGADVVVLLDVLYFLDPAAQECLLRRIHTALTPTGLLLARIADAGGGLGFWLTQAVDRAVAGWKGLGWSRFHCRTLAGWTAFLAAQGFACESLPMSQGTPFANVLLIARPTVTSGR